MEITQYDCLQEKNINIGTGSTYLLTCPLLGDQKINDAKNSSILPSI